MQFIGFDPGGKKAFGWAVVEATPRGLSFIDGGVVTGALNALASASAAITGTPAGIGIDAPLFWVSDGDRNADLYVRTLVCSAGGHSGTVSHVNSLRGACLVEGVIVAKLSQERWPDAPITESHPKALLRLSSAAQKFISSPKLRTVADHVRDAALGAYAAHAMVARLHDWHDLIAKELSPFFPAGNRVAYWFPKHRS